MTDRTRERRPGRAAAPLVTDLAVSTGTERSAARKVIPIRQDLAIEAKLAEDRTAARKATPMTRTELAALRLSKAGETARTHPDPLKARAIEMAIVEAVSVLLEYSRIDR